MTAEVLQPAAEVASRTFQVLLSRKSEVESALAALAKRCARRSLPTIEIAWGKAYTRREHTANFGCSQDVSCSGCRHISRIPLTLTGEAPKYAGWTMVAALTHVEGETVVRSHGEIPAIYRTRGSDCDHCHTSRQRAETYVVRHDDGRYMQVGSSCLKDFLGHEEAEKLALQATMLYLAYGAAEDGEESGLGGGSYSDHLTLEEYLPMVAWCVREQGWVSRTKAREHDMGAATADSAMMYVTDSKARKLANAEPTEDDAKLATDAMLWAESLTDEQVSGQSDYLHNLRVVARAGYVTHKLAGVGGSMIVAYERHIGRERVKAQRALMPPSTHVGTVGVRTCWTATLDFVTGFETAFGYTTVLKFRTDDVGAVVTWMASGQDVLARSDVGKRYMVCGTVKKHDEYKGEKQTVISRADVRDFDQAAWDAHCAEETRKDLAAKVKAGTATDAEQAQYKAIQAARRADSKAKSAHVAKFLTFECETFVSHYPMTHTALKVSCPSGDIMVDYSESRRYVRPGSLETVDASHITVRHGGAKDYSKWFQGDKALTNARKFVAELLAEEVAS